MKDPVCRFYINENVKLLKARCRCCFASKCHSLQCLHSAVMTVLHVSCINWMDQGNIELIKIIHG